MQCTVGSVRAGGLATLLAVIAASSITLSTHATQTAITAQVCQPYTSATIEINSPRSDSVVTQPAVIVSGTATHVSQVELYSNNDYVKTVAIARGESLFQTKITLGAGTTTLRAQGFNVCGGDSATDQVVITYRVPDQPTAQPGDVLPPASGGVQPPSVGADTPTVINPDMTQYGAGVVVSKPNNEPDSSSAEGQDRYMWWQNGAGTRIIDWLSETLDIRLLPRDGTEPSTVWIWMRVGAIIVGVGLLTFGRFVTGICSRTDLISGSMRRLTDSIIRACGFLLIVISLGVL